MPERPAPHPREPHTFQSRVAIALLLVSLFVALMLMLWYTSQVLLLLFASVLLAVVLRSAANAVARWTKLSPTWSLVVVILVTLALGAAAGWAAAPSIATQLESLRDNLRGSVETVGERVAEMPGGEQVVEKVLEARDSLVNRGELWQQVGGYFSSTLGVLAGLLVVVFVGGFLAFDPRLYLNGLLRLVPVDKRERADEVLANVGETLQGWLVGQIISMALLFVTTWVMLLLLGVPLALILALVTGIMTFVPYVGPLVALVPILLIAFVESPALALQAGLLYMVVQNIEANVVMPIVFQRTVHLPPALSIAGQLILGALFGILGFILATPLTAVLLVLTQRLYVEDVLGDSMRHKVQDRPLPASP
jgi:predicted PurR-regulated permease PerM